MGKTEKEEKGMRVLCTENHWDGQNFFEDGTEYLLSPDYPLPKITVRKNAKGQVLRSVPKFEPINAAARKAFEKLSEDVVEESEQEASPSAAAIAEVIAIIRDNGLDEDEIKTLFKDKKAKKAEDKLKALKAYMES